MSTGDREKKPNLVKAADIDEQRVEGFGHPLNPNAEIGGAVLGDLVGLQRIGINLIEIPPGKEANIYHRHYREEEVFYILSGTGTAVIDEEEYEIGPGDVLGFPTPQVAHLIKNTSDAPLTYLAIGERAEVEIADYPWINKRLVRVGDAAWSHDLDAETRMWPPEDEAAD